MSYNESRKARVAFAVKRVSILANQSDPSCYPHPAV